MKSHITSAAIALAASLATNSQAIAFDSETFSAAGSCTHTRGDRGVNPGQHGDLHTGYDEVDRWVYCHVPSEGPKGRHFSKIKVVYVRGLGPMEFRLCFFLLDGYRLECSERVRLRYDDGPRESAASIRPPRNYDVGTSIVPPAVFLKAKIVGVSTPFYYYTVVWTE